MYGWINASLESLILNNYGPEVWARITEEAGCTVQVGDFIRNVNYPDELTKRLIEASCKLLNMSQEELVESSGVNFIRYVKQNGYESTIRCQGTTFQEWLRNLNEPHRLLKSRFPDSKFPEFWCVNDDEDETGEVLILHYYSYRGELFAPMVIGCVKEAAKVYFHLDVELDLVFQKLNENTLHAAWRVFSEQSLSAKSPKKRTKLNHSLEWPLNLNTANQNFGESENRENSMDLTNFRSCNELMETAKHTGKCPFSHMKSSAADCIQLDQNPAIFAKIAAAQQSNGTLSSSNSSCSGSADSSNDHFQNPRRESCKDDGNIIPNNCQIGLTPQRLKDAFPFHIVINSKLQIIQLGDKMARLILTHHPYASIINGDVRSFFGIAIPPNYPWDWYELTKLEDTTIELNLLKTPNKISFRGAFCILNPNADGQFVTEVCAMFLININIHDINEMQAFNLKLSDFPRHNFQRDLLIIGEHLKSEALSAVEFGVLSKKLNQESKSSLNALKTKRVFVRYVSHEIRTPLNITLLGLKYLEGELEKNDTKLLGDVNDVLEDVKSSCGIAVDILNDLLLYEKLDDGIFTLSMSEVPFRDFFMDAVNVFKVQALSFDIDFVVDCKGLDSVVVNIDRMKFSQVLRNLVSNALKFTPRKGQVTVVGSVVKNTEHNDTIIFADSLSVVSSQSVHSDVTSSCSVSVSPSTSSTPLNSVVNMAINNLGRRSYLDLVSPRMNLATADSDVHQNVSTKHEKEFLRISITDTGPGINQEDQKLLFHEFTQFKADKLQNGQGSGLGLWIADNIMQLHGGRIGIYSEGEGKGSTFVVDLPISSSQVDANIIHHCGSGIHNKDEDITLAVVPEADADVLKTKRMLIVDDAPTNRKIVHKMLRGKFMRIDEAENGQEAVDKYLQAMQQDQPYDVVMMDFLMPVMNGLESTKIIRAYNLPTVIVGVTGNGLQSDIDLFMDAGVDSVMIKPLEISQFISFLTNKFTSAH